MFHKLVGALSVTMLGVVLMVAGCKVGGENTHQPFPGATVPGVVAAPDCADVDGVGPCVMVDDAPDGTMHRWFVGEGGQYPDAAVDLGPVSADDPLYVAQCRDVDGKRGPCVGQVGDSDMWVFVPEGGTWPVGVAVVLCPDRAGGPAPCAWLPSVQGGDSGDSGALVYGVVS